MRIETLGTREHKANERKVLVWDGYVSGRTSGGHSLPYNHLRHHRQRGA